MILNPLRPASAGHKPIQSGLVVEVHPGRRPAHAAAIVNHADAPDLTVRPLTVSNRVQRFAQMRHGLERGATAKNKRRRKAWVLAAPIGEAETA
jgi:hypothetical protein